jgi:hypothetical protein
MGAADSMLEHVHFSRISKRKSELATLTTQAILFVAFFLGLILFRVLVFVGGRVGLGGRFALILVSAVVIGVLIAIAVRDFRRGLRLKANPHREADERARLRCVGLPQELAKWGELRDAPFEPLVFTGWFTHRLPPFMRAMVAVLTVPAFIVAHLMISGLTSLWTREEIVLKLWLALLSARGIVSWLWPTYFRVVPGRLDVMRFSNIRGRAVATRHFDLRKARILVDLRRNVVFIDEDGDSEEFAIGLMPGRTRFAHALFWAALSTHEPPPLPENELLG